MSGYGSAYGTVRWTCGECGDSYEADGVVGDSKVHRWERDHREKHRIEKMSEAERAEYYRLRFSVTKGWG